MEKPLVKLFLFCRKYIIEKFDSHGSAYAVRKTIKEHRCLLKKSHTFLELRFAILQSQQKKIYSIGNYTIVIKFCQYVLQENFPYMDKPFDMEFVSDFIWIYTGGKKQTTKAFYSKIIQSFVIEYNINIHKNNSDIAFYYPPKNYSSYLSYNERLTDNEIKKLFIALNAENIVFSTIIQIILHTGIRISETLNIKHKDIYFSQNLYMINIKGKGTIYRLVPLKKEVFFEYYYEYVKSLSSEEFVFRTRTKKAISRHYIYRKLKKIFFEIGIAKDRDGPHLLRHTFASKLYEKCRDIVLVQECIGHANIETTRRYIHIHHNELRKQTSIFDGYRNTLFTTF